MESFEKLLVAVQQDLLVALSIAATSQQTLLTRALELLVIELT